MLIKILMVLLMVSMAHTEWRWADDSDEFTMDKKAHFLGSAGAYFFFRHKDYSVEESMLYSFYLGLGKEVIDAVLPYEKYGSWGGDGFSKYDLMYDVAGILCAYGIDKVWKPKENKNDFRFGFNNTGISFSFRIY
tara:strand:- start:1964 stop:2368 length:405 start_codon:yes stop_codon:yes gene_type:complete